MPEYSGWNADQEPAPSPRPEVSCFLITSFLPLETILFDESSQYFSKKSLLSMTISPFFCHACLDYELSFLPKRMNPSSPSVGDGGQLSF
jgi:hypothetical protein